MRIVVTVVVVVIRFGVRGFGSGRDIVILFIITHVFVKIIIIINITIVVLHSMTSLGGRRRSNNGRYRIGEMLYAYLECGDQEYVVTPLPEFFFFQLLL